MSQTNIQLQCKNCGGNLTIDSQREVLICPFCGSEELITDSDAVAVEKIRQKTTCLSKQQGRNCCACLCLYLRRRVHRQLHVSSQHLQRIIWDCAFDSNSKFSALFSGAKGGYSSAKAVALRRK